MFDDIRLFFVMFNNVKMFQTFCIRIRISLFFFINKELSKLKDTLGVS